MFEGLKEMGLTKSEYRNLSRSEKKDVHEALKEMGHLE